MKFRTSILMGFTAALLSFNTSLADNVIVANSENPSFTIQKLQEQLNRLQAHVYTALPLEDVDTSATPTKASSKAEAIPVEEAALDTLEDNKNKAQLSVQIEELRTEIASLRGQLEEAIHTATLQTTKVDKLEQELAAAVEKIKALEEIKASNPTPASAPISTPADDDTNATPAPKAVIATLSTEEMVTNEIKAMEPADAYQKAKDYISQGDFEKAEVALRTFIETFETHELIGPVYYYLGELHYIQKKFKEALTIFAESYKLQPKGIKAPDALLKMAQCLDALKQSKEACATLAQLKKNFSKLDSGIKAAAHALSNQLKCSHKTSSKHK